MARYYDFKRPTVCPSVRLSDMIPVSEVQISSGMSVALRPDFTLNLIHELAFGTHFFSIALYGE